MREGGPISQQHSRKRPREVSPGPNRAVGGAVDDTRESEAGGAYDLDRLERAVAALIERGRRLQAENSQLCSELEERDRRISTLDERVLEINQHRQDAIKRIDDLIAQMDQLDAQLSAGETGR